MKKQFFFAMLSAIALSGAALFTGCSSTDDVTTEDINPTYDPTTNTVKANFSLSLTSKLGDAKAGTRMQADSVQATTIFHGIKNISLIPFDITEKIAPAPTGGALPNRYASNINLPTSIAADKTHENAQDGSYNYHFVNVPVPVGTGAFLFYGVSGTGNNNASGATMFANGILDPQGDFATGNPGDFAFNLVPIITTDPTDPENNADLKAVLEYLNGIASATDEAATPTAWSATTNAVLSELYKTFIGFKTASTANVRLAIQDLYTSLYPMTDALSVGIKHKILAANYGSSNNVAYATDADGNGTSTGTLTFQGAMNNNFPENILLPRGAVAITWNSSATPAVFEAVPHGQYSNMDLSNPTKFVYPASLYYFANTTILTSPEKEDNAYKTGATDWATVKSAYTTPGNQVLNTTVDIALNDEINYSVGQLELKVQVAAGDAGQDYPGKKVVYDRKKNEVVIDNGFPVTGVLIGGMRNLDWQFFPVPQATDATGGTTVVTNEYTIYDNAVRGTGLTASETTGSTPTQSNYTLVPQTDDDKTIYMALEMINNSGEEFIGYDGIVPNGAKFYLVAALNPKATSGVTGYGDGTGSTITKKVFLQDYRTNVVLTIGKNDTLDAGATDYTKGLGAAYLTIPDLGTPAVRLGFYVDLTWNQGLIFNQDL